MKCTLLRDMACTPCLEHPAGVKPAGTVIDHPDAFRLVQLGCAEPADDQCAAAHGRTPEQLEAARIAYVRVERGILPEDYERYDNGVITGYNPDGSCIPGPNWTGDEEDESEDDEEPA